MDKKDCGKPIDGYDYEIDRNRKEKVELIEGEEFSCSLGEDGLYQAT